MKTFLLLFLSAFTALSQSAVLQNAAIANAQVGIAAAGYTTNVFAVNDAADGDYWQGAHDSQGIKNTGTITIVKVGFKSNHESGVSYAFEIRSAINGGGTLFGTTATNTTSEASTSWLTNACDAVSVTGDFYLTMKPVSGTTPQWRSTTTNQYEDTTTYTVYNDGSQSANQDFNFVIYTRQ